MSEKTRLRPRNSFGQAFEAIGPILAGFQLAAYVIGFFGSGALAKWVLENWFPFTRYVWSLVLLAIDFPDISAAEKDALTTMVFFAPMGVWALYSKCTNRVQAPSAALRIPALFVGAAFIIILGEQFIRDAMMLATAIAKTPSSDPVLVALKDLKSDFEWLFLMAGIVAGVLGILSISIAAFGAWIAPDAPNLLKRQVPAPTRAEPKRIMRCMFAMGQVSALFSTFVGGLSVFYFDVGPIRSLSMVATLLLMLLTVYFNPARLLVSFGVFLMFVSCSFGFDLLMWIVTIVQNAPKELVVPKN